MLLFSIISNILAKKAFIMNANNSSWVKSKTLSIFTIKRLWMQSYKVCLVLFMSLLLAGCGNDNNSNDKAADEVALKTIAAGSDHSFAISNDGKIYATGDNYVGQLGLGDNNNRTVFTEVVDLSDKNITAAAAGRLHSFAISNNGKIYAAGNNAYGQLGLGDYNNRAVFTEVSNLSDKNITAVAVGGYHSFAISDDGKIYAAGFNRYGQLGFGDYNNRADFTEVSNLSNKNIAAVTAGRSYSFAISDDGKVYAAGNNNLGQLGFGDSIDRADFTEVSDLKDKNITAIAVGYSYSLALSSDGRVYAAGENSYGQLGFGDHKGRNAFTEVSNLSDKNITAVAAGNSHSLALSNNGKIYAAGSNSVGQIGLGNRVHQNNFTKIIIPNYQ